MAHKTDEIPSLPLVDFAFDLVPHPKLSHTSVVKFGTFIVLRQNITKLSIVKPCGRDRLITVLFPADLLGSANVF